MTTDRKIIRGDLLGHSGCFACGSDNPRSLGIVFESQEDGTIVTAFKAPGELQGYDNIMHGGIVTTLLDSAMAYCLFNRGVRALTAEAKVRFLKPIPCGVEIEIRARLASCCRKLYSTSAEILVGKVVSARAEAKFIPLKEKC